MLREADRVLAIAEKLGNSPSFAQPLTDRVRRDRETPVSQKLRTTALKAWEPSV